MTAANCSGLGLGLGIALGEAPLGTLMIHVHAGSGEELLRQQRRFRAETTKHEPQLN